MKKSLLFLFALVMFKVTFGQLTGTYTIPGATYSTIAAAITALNASGVGAGGVTFNVSAGYAETFSSPTAGYITTNTGTAANPIIFQKSGSGANPVITAGTGTTTNLDAIICFNGVQYITFNGIDLSENPANTTTTTQMEWGYAILKASATQGSQNITIKNCTITLNKANTVTYGIYSNNHTSASTTQLTVTATTGQNSNNKFYGNTITNSYGGIYIYGYADGVSPYLYYDQNNDIGSVTGNVFNNFAGGASTAYVVYAYYQNGLSIANCNINGSSAGTGSIYGIYGGTATNANVNIYGNTITINQTVATTGYIYGIYNSGLGTSGTTNTLNIYNNTVQNCTEPNSTTSYLYAIYNASTAFTINLYGNTVNNNVFGGSYYMYLCYSTSASGGTLYAYNNIISNNQRTGAGTQSSSSYFYCLYLAGSATISVHDNQVFGNSATGLSTYGAYFYSLYLPTSSPNMTVYNNTVHDQTISSSYTSAHAIFGVYGYSTVGLANVYNNTVYNLIMNNSSTGYGYGYGFYIYGYPLNLYKNKVYNVNAPGTSGYYYGMYFPSGSTTNAYNNYISDLRAPTSTSATALVGIYASAGTAINLYYNTVYLNATSTSATTFGTCALYAAGSATTPAEEVRNNILVNTSTASGSSTYIAAAYRRSSNVLTNYVATSNNNDFYAGPPSTTHLIFYDGTNSIQTLAAYKSWVSPRDAQSVTELPPFLNIATTPYNLHINTAVPTQMESGGSIVSSPVNITTDYDNDPRYPNSGYPNNVSYNATAPDIGADEFGGLLLDLSPPAINLTQFANTSSTTPRTLITTITDQTGVPVSGTGLPMLYWKKFYTGTWTGVQAVFGGSNQYTFSNIGTGVVLGDSIYYYLVAQDLVTPTPNIGAIPSTGASGYTANPPAVSTPPTTLYAYKIVPAMCGTFNVGAGQTYTSFTAAINALNNGEMTCPVTLLLKDANYSASETFPIVLNNVAGLSATNTLTIKPAPGVTAKISGTSATGIFVLMGTQYVTIDGSNSGGSDQSLTFQQTNTVSNTYCFGLFNNGLVGASNCTIKNCKFRAGAMYPGSVANTTYAFIFNGAGGGYNNVIVKNNQIYSGYEGMQLAGIAGFPASNCQVINNTIGSVNDTTSLTKYGIFMAQADNCLVANNEIMGGPLGNTNYLQTGIYMSTGTTNCKIRANKIHDWFYVTLSGGWGNFGIYFASDATTVNEISNNVIYNIKCDSYTTGVSSDNLYGVYIGSGGNIKFYHNSINMQGNFTSSTYTNATACVGIVSGITLLDFQNNIFKNSLQPSTSGFTSYTYGIQCAGTAATFSTLNYNDYWVDGNGPNIGYLGSTQYATMAAWRTATGGEANGINVNPLFTSPTNLLPTAAALSHAGTYLALVPADINGVAHPNPPDIGAYQFSGLDLVNTTAATSINLTGATLNGNITANNLTVTSGFDYGLTTIYGSSAATVIPATVTGNTLTTISTTLTLLPMNTLYHYRAKGTSGSTIIYGSDMTFTTGGPPIMVTAPATTVGATFATLNGTVNPNWDNTTVSFEYGLTTNYGTPVTVTGTYSGNTVQSFSANLTSLLINNTYHYRAKGINGGGTVYGSDQSFFTTCVVPPLPGAISGPAAVCKNGSGYSYSVVQVAYGFVYNWTFPAGFTITSYPHSNVVTVSVSNSAVSGTISVYASSDCGANSPPSTMAVIVNNLPVPTVSGPSPVCQFGNNNYSTQAGNSAYQWTATPDGTITPTGDPSIVTVNWPTTGSKTVGVVYTSSSTGCTAAAPGTLPVTVIAAPVPTITGTSSLCLNSGYYSYTTETGMTAYSWSLYGGGSIISGQGTNSVEISWTAAGSWTVSVVYTNSTGCAAGSPTNYTVTVSGLPGPAGTIVGSSNVCYGSMGIGYSVPSITNATTYVWTLPAGATIATGQNTNSITVNFAANAVSGNITVYGNSLCGNGSVSPPFYVNVIQLPADAGAITGASSVCEGETGVPYSVPPIANATGYNWSLPPGAIIASGASTANITVDFPMGTLPGVIYVFGTNPCGNGTASPLFDVNVIAKPAAPVITQSGDILSSNIAVGNQWYYNGAPITGATGQTQQAQYDGWYWDVIITNGCSSDSSNNIYVVITGIANPQATNFMIAPVPNDGFFKATINIPVEQSFTIMVYNQLGEMIYESKDNRVKGLFEKNIDLRPIPSGIYSVIFQSAENRIVKKIIVNQ